MNAAARLVNHQGVFSRSWVVSVFLTQYHFAIFLLILAILISSLSLVYVTNETRSFNADLQDTLSKRDRLHLEWGQLLLEKSTLTTEARTQKLAEKLEMIFPDGKLVVIVRD